LRALKKTDKIKFKKEMHVLSGDHILNFSSLLLTK